MNITFGIRKLLSLWKLNKFNSILPRRNQLSNIQWNTIGLRNKHSSNSFIKSCSIHVHRGTKRQHKTTDTRINLVMSLNTAHGGGQSRRTKESQLKWRVT